MDEHDPWTILSERRMYENPWLALDERQVLNPAGTPGVYGIVRFKRPAVGVLAIEADGAVHLVGQWRPPIAAYSWEIPEGGCEAGETPIEAARRELEEEAGVIAGELHEVLRLTMSNSVTDERATGFIAWNLAPGRKQPDETEILGHRRLPFRALLEEIAAGQVHDALSVAVALRAHYMAVTGGLPPALAQAMLG